MILVLLSLFAWGFIFSYSHNHPIKGICSNVRGGGGTEITYPQPAAAPSSAEAIEAWISGMPRIFAEQQRQAPLEAQQQIQLMQQYAEPFGQALLTGQQAMYPQTTALQEQMAGMASQGMQAGVPSWAREQYLDEMRGMLGEQVGAGIGADYMSRGLMQQQQDWQRYYTDLGLSLAGRQPLAQPTMPQTSQYTAGWTPQGTWNQMLGGYGAYQQAARPITTQGTDWLGGIGGLMGGVGAMGMAFSSILLKENIEEIDDALEKIEKLEGVKFDWKETSMKDGGVIAEELERIIPDAVTEINGIKAIKPMMIIAYIIEAVKELSRQVKQNG